MWLIILDGIETAKIYPIVLIEGRTKLKDCKIRVEINRVEYEDGLKLA